MVKSETITVVGVKTMLASYIDMNLSAGSTAGSVTIKGVLYGMASNMPLEHKTVRLYQNGSYVKSTTTGYSYSSGMYLFTVTVGSGTTSFQVKFEGDSLYTACESPEMDWNYEKIQTSFYGFKVEPLYGDVPFQVTIIAQLRRDDTGYGLNGKTVELYKNNVKIGTYVTQSTSGGNGFILFKDTVTEEGNYDYYVFFPGDAEFAGCE